MGKFRKSSILLYWVGPTEDGRRCIALDHNVWVSLKKAPNVSSKSRQVRFKSDHVWSWSWPSKSSLANESLQGRWRKSSSYSSALQHRVNSIPSNRIKSSLHCYWWTTIPVWSKIVKFIPVTCPVASPSPSLHPVPSTKSSLQRLNWVQFKKQ